jgi:hypothetical protein
VTCGVRGPQGASAGLVAVQRGDVTEPNASHPLLALLIEHWTVVLALLSPGDRSRLVELVTGSDPLPVRAARVNQLLLKGLPPDAEITAVLFGSGVGVRLVGHVDVGSWQRLAGLASSVGLSQLDLTLAEPTRPEPAQADPTRAGFPAHPRR